MNHLRFYMEKAGLNQNQLAVASGEDRQQIGKLLKRPALHPKWAEILAPFVNATPRELLVGPEPSDASVANPTYATVAGEAAAGLWRERETWDEEKYPPVPATPGIFPGIPQTAFRIQGPSMDKLKIFDGDFVLTVPYWEVRQSIRNGDVVMIERTQGQLVELTCKQIALNGNTAELWPRSTDPRHQEPLKIPQRQGPSHEEGDTIEVIALVVGRFGYVGTT